MTHIHFTSPPNKKGPLVDKLFRCVRCSKSTRNKKHIACNMSENDGGRLCIPCWEISDKSSNNCHVWARSSSRRCFICSIIKDNIGECLVCKRSVCDDCTSKCSLDLLRKKGALFLVCSSCDISGNSSTDINSHWCHWCLAHHDLDSNGSRICGYDGNTIPKWIKVLKGVCPPPKITPSPTILALLPTKNSVCLDQKMKDFFNSQVEHGNKSPSKNTGSFYFQPNHVYRKSGKGYENKFSDRSSSSLKIQNVGHSGIDTRTDNPTYCIDKSQTIRSSKNCKSANISVPSVDCDTQLQGGSGSKTSPQFVNFMASMCEKINDLSNEVNNLKLSGQIVNPASTEISVDTDTCKGIQCKPSNIKKAYDSIPLTLNELLAEQKVQNAAMFKELNSCMTTLAAELSKFTDK